MEQVLGQEHAIDVLQSAMQAERMHHAYIFHGPVGVGKFTTARALAAALLCHQPQRDLVGRVEACGSCESCKLLRDSSDSESNAHPDLHVIRKEMVAYSGNSQLRNRKLLNIPVDLLRERMIGGKTGDNKSHSAPAYKTAMLRHGKVFIIDEAELLEPVGQNALLKTLEEPPDETYIILVSSKEHRLLPTIRSRCHRIAFRPLPDRIVADWLAEHRNDLNDDHRQWLVSFADGSIGRAVLAADYDLHRWAKFVEPALDGLARGRYPTQLGAFMSDAIKTFAEAWVKEHDNASKEAANKRGAALMWSLISQHARKNMQAAAAQCDPADPSAADAAMAPWLGTIDALEDVQRQLAANVNLAHVVDHVVAVIGRAHRLTASARG